MLLSQRALKVTGSLTLKIDALAKQIFEDIGVYLGVSKERVRQIEQQAMLRLKKEGIGLGLEDFLDE